VVTAASGNFGERFCPVYVHSLGSMAREAAPFASRKCRVYKVSLAEANGTIVLGAVLSRGVLLAHPLAFIRSCIVASLSDLCIHHLPLDSCVLLVHPFALLSVSFLLALSLSLSPTSNFVSPDIPELLVLAPFP